MNRHDAPPTIVQDPSEEARREMIARIGRGTPSDGDHRTTIPRLALFRWSSSSTVECSVVRPSLVITVQGQKRLDLAGEKYEYGLGRGLITALSLPVLAQIFAVSAAEPYLCLVYELDPPRIAELMAELKLAPPRTIPEGRAISVCRISAPIFDAALRLMRLLDEPADIPILAPLVERELLYRLLTGEQGMRLRHLATHESQTFKIARAIDYLRQNFTRPLRIESLADHVGMSVSSLHHHFKAVTSMSPLQYHKQLRLHEARSLMIRRMADVTSAAYSVGYESPSHFTRDYARVFGAPPTRDPALLREAP